MVDVEVIKIVKDPKPVVGMKLREIGLDDEPNICIIHTVKPDNTFAVTWDSGLVGDTFWSMEDGWQIIND